MHRQPIAILLLLVYLAAWPGGQVMHWLSGCPHYITGRLPATCRMPVARGHEVDGCAREVGPLACHVVRPACRHAHSHAGTCPFTHFQLKTPTSDLNLVVLEGHVTIGQLLPRVLNRVADRTSAVYHSRAPPA